MTPIFAKLRFLPLLCTAGLALCVLPVCADAWREAESARAMLHAYRAHLAAYQKSAATTPEHEKETAGEALRLAAAPAAERTTPRGLRLEAYVAANDGAPQPFYRYLPANWSTNTPLPLLVYLHGYYPYSHLSPPGFPSSFTNLAERGNFAIAAPFGRGNTDFQGIGEQDVLRVIDLMQRRYNTDPRRVLIAGFSMGAMGAWNIASRWPRRFNGLFGLANRGDFYTWHGVGRDTLPPWQRRIIDTQFAATYAHRLAATPILALHGGGDQLMPLREAEAIFSRVAAVNSNAFLKVVPDAGHQELSLQFADPEVADWLLRTLQKPAPVAARAPLPPPRFGIPEPARYGATGSRAQDMFLDPFIIVGDARQPAVGDAVAAWFAFTGSIPRNAREADLTPAQLAGYSLLFRAEPEDSALVAGLFARHNITFTDGTLTCAGRTLPRKNRGFWIALPSPHNPARTWLVNLGIPWGRDLPPNHYYDRIPDFICYTPLTGAFDLPLPAAVGFLNDAGVLQWSDPATTPAATGGTDSPPNGN